MKSVSMAQFGPLLTIFRHCVGPIWATGLPMQRDSRIFSTGPFWATYIYYMPYARPNKNLKIVLSCRNRRGNLWGGFSPPDSCKPVFCWAAKILPACHDFNKPGFSQFLHCPLKCAMRDAIITQRRIRREFKRLLPGGFQHTALIHPKRFRIQCLYALIPIH